MWARGEAAVSHLSAPEMMELCDVLPRHIRMTVPETYNPRKAGGEEFRVHRHTLPNTDLTYFEGVPVTAYRAIRQAIGDGEDPAQMFLAIRNASSEGLLLRSEAALPSQTAPMTATDGRCAERGEPANVGAIKQRLRTR